MKKTQTWRWMIAATMFAMPALLFSQPVESNRSVESFSAVEVSGSTRVELVQGAPHSVLVKTAPETQDMIVTVSRDDVLKVTTKGDAKATLIITSPLISRIKTGDLAEVTGTGTIKQEKLQVEASGASKIELNVEVDELETRISGASTVEMSGHAGMHSLRVSGASIADFADLQSKEVVLNASGASNVKLDVSDKIDGKTSGIATVTLKKEPESNLLVSSVGSGSLTTQEKDSIAKDIEEVVEIVMESINNEVDYEAIAENVTKKVSKKKKNKFNGHFKGVELGVNTYLNRYNEMNLPADADYMALKIPNSLTVNLNIIEGNLPLIKQNLGLVTGLGFEFNNYKFEESNYIRMEDGRIKAVAPPAGVTFEKSKLSCTYLKVPFIIEYQTNSKSKKNSFHIAGGANLGLRLRSHTKYKYEVDGKTIKEKEWERFYLNPYRVAGIVKLGWGPLNFFAEYNLLTLFEQGKGPELYPVSFGIALANW